jgi:secreted trypsin-like serine protease
VQLARPLLAAALLALALPAAAILIRADRDDAEYLELATRYTSSVPLNAPDGEGVLIAPRWVLTAAHRARTLQEMKPMPKLDIAGRAHEIQSIIIHPDWRSGEANDIALILLRRDVTAIEATPVYHGSDEAGKPVVIVGHGSTGKIGEKARAADRKKRASVNTVDRVAPRTLGLRVKSGDDASDLQGAATPGDSGGPAFIETPAGLWVAGIAHGTEGEWETYARVSAFATWIEAVMLDVAAKEAAALLEDRR